jgi:hypothetical protein
MLTELLLLGLGSSSYCFGRLFRPHPTKKDFWSGGFRGLAFQGSAFPFRTPHSAFLSPGMSSSQFGLNLVDSQAMSCWICSVADPTFGEAAKRAIRTARQDGSLVICDIVYAELSPLHATQESLDEKLRILGILLEPASPRRLLYGGPYILAVP